jgi:hypothetical protein
MCVWMCVCVRPFRQGMARGERERARDGGRYRGQIGREGSIIAAVLHTT